MPSSAVGASPPPPRGIRPSYDNRSVKGDVHEYFHVLAECAISAGIVDVHTGSIVWSDTASETLPLESRDISGVVSGITAAARITVDRLVKSKAKALAPAVEA